MLSARNKVSHLNFKLFRTQHLSRVHCILRCLEKNYWVDSECALSAVAIAALLTVDRFHLSFHYFHFHHFSCDPASSVLASKRTGVKLCLNGCTLWSLGSWLGGPWVSARCLVASRTRQWPSCIFVCLVVGLFSFSMASVDDGTEAAIAINPIERTAVPWWLVSFGWWFCFCCVCFLCFVLRCCFLFLFRVWVVFVFVPSCHGTAFWTMYRFMIALFCGLLTFAALHVIYQLPIQFPASTNLLNDLAKAMKALDGKNCHGSDCAGLGCEMGNDLAEESFMRLPPALAAIPPSEEESNHNTTPKPDLMKQINFKN